MKIKLVSFILFTLSEIFNATSAWPTSLNNKSSQDDEIQIDAFFKSLYLDTYESMSAIEKQNMLFQEIESTNSTQGEYPNILGLVGLILGKPFDATVDTYSDFFPGKDGKGIHSVGPAAKIVFQPSVTYKEESSDSIIENVSNTTTLVPTDDAATNTTIKKRREKVAHPFTGLFAEKTHGIIRLSLAVDLRIPNSAFTPGIGVKLFRDGMPSANFVAMENVDGQESGNFFEADFSNHIPKPNKFAQKLLARKFKQTSSVPEFVGLSDIATYYSNGEKVSNEYSKGNNYEDDEGSKISFPFEVILKPNEQLKRKFSNSAPTDEAMKETLTSIPEGTIIYSMYGRAEPEDKDLIFIGTFQLTSRLIYSKFSDNGLFFRHQLIEEDLEIRRDWDDPDKLQKNPEISRRRRRLGEKIKCPMAALH